MTNRKMPSDVQRVYANSPYEHLQHPWLVWLSLLAVLALIVVISTVPLRFEQQFLFALIALGLSLLIRRDNENARLQSYVLIFISCVATGRYIFWRLTESLGWSGGVEELSFTDKFFSFGLLAAEIYAWIVMYLGYFQTLWPLKRVSQPLPQNRALWPSVDIFIPTYNEPLKVVGPTIVAAKNIDWPEDRLNIYLLDDGRRDEFREFAESAGVHYITREDNKHAKAGNINHALNVAHGDYVAIFDCDHVPTRSFLTKTMGWFLCDPKLGLLQTPHLFCTPDPVERNLGVFRRIPNEGQLFYGLIQDGNDTWNATFFCGSCAVLKRDALDDIGGIATDTVTEDAHTSLTMHRRGWNSAYLNEPLAAGLATERLSAHVRQRTRWAVGMIQVFRLDNPLFGRGLTWAQRFSYLNAMLHFFFSLPRLIFLSSPLAFLFFEAHIIQATAAMIAVYALPHIFQAHIANSSLQRRFRHGFWSEVYETILAAHIFWPTVKAFFSPRNAKFNVTDKGGIIEGSHFDWHTAKPLFILLLINLAGFILGVGRFMLWNTHEIDTVVMNMAWSLYNLIILGAALAVAWERQQRRTSIRLPRQEKAVISLGDGLVLDGVTQDLSLNDARLRLHRIPEVRVGDPVTLTLFNGNGSKYSFTGRAASLRGRDLALTFDNLNPQQLSNLLYFSHMREGVWKEWYGTCEPKRTLRSFLEVVHYGLLGLARSLFGYSDAGFERRTAVNYTVAGWLFILIIVALGSHFFSREAQAQEAVVNENIEAVARERYQGTNVRRLSFDKLGIEKPLHLSHTNAEQNVYFSLRSDERPVEASVAIEYSLSPELEKDFNQVNVLLNNRPLGEIIIDKHTVGAKKTRTLPIDPILIGENNHLTMHLVGKDPAICKTLDETVGAVIGNQSEITLVTQSLKIVNDLNFFPLPFFDTKDPTKLIVHFVIPSAATSSLTHLRAAGLLASWLGAEADYRGASFPVHVGSIPDNNAIVLITQDTPLSLEEPLTITGPGLQVMTNPRNPYTKLLFVMGRNAEELQTAAHGLITGQFNATGNTAQLTAVKPWELHQPYDAPRWGVTSRVMHFSELTEADNLKVKSLPIDSVLLDFRAPPDLFAWYNRPISLTMSYHYPNLSYTEDSQVSISVNDRFLKRISLQHEQHDTSMLSRLQKGLKGEIRNDNDNDELTKQRIGRVKLQLSSDDLRDFNRLRVDFNLKTASTEDSGCAAVAATGNMQAGIDPNSTLDFTEIYHYTRLPDLAKFANMGFPFTRYADLAETVIVLPDNPVNTDIQAMLEVLGKMGAATGVPASKVTLLHANRIDTAKDKDILLIGNQNSQPLYRLWQNEMPLVRKTSGEGWRVREPSFVENLLGRMSGFREDENIIAGSRAVAAANGDLTALMQFRSPLNTKRSVVALAADHSANTTMITNAMVDPHKVRTIQGDTAVFSHRDVTSLRTGGDYYVGDVPWWTSLRWYLSRYFIVYLALFIGLVLLAAMLLRALLRHRAARRFEFQQQYS